MGPRILVHVCDCSGRWEPGQGSPEARLAYLRWSEQGFWGEEPFGLGGMQLVARPPDLWFANLVARSQDESMRYGALETCLDKLQGQARRLGASILMPRLGEGDWSRVEKLLQKMLSGLEVFLYEPD